MASSRLPYYGMMAEKKGKKQAYTQLQDWGGGGLLPSKWNSLSIAMYAFLFLPIGRNKKAYMAIDNEFHFDGKRPPPPPSLGAAYIGLLLAFLFRHHSVVG